MSNIEYLKNHPNLPQDIANIMHILEDMHEPLLFFIDSSYDLSILSRYCKGITRKGAIGVIEDVDLVMLRLIYPDIRGFPAEFFAI